MQRKCPDLHFELRKEDVKVPPSRENVTAKQMSGEVRGVLQYMLPTIPLDEMTVTSGPENVRRRPYKDTGLWQGVRHTASDVQAKENFKNAQGETARHGLGEPVRSPIEGKIIRIDEKANGLIIADQDGNVIGVRHMKRANNPRDKDGNPLKPEDADKQREWQRGDIVKTDDTLGFIHNIGGENRGESLAYLQGGIACGTTRESF